MSFFWIFFLLLTESLARESQVSYAWNSTSACILGYLWHDGQMVTRVDGRCKDATEDVHILLKQGLKIGYLPPSRYNSKFIS